MLNCGALPILIGIEFTL